MRWASMMTPWSCWACSRRAGENMLPALRCHPARPRASRADWAHAVPAVGWRPPSARSLFRDLRIKVPIVVAALLSHRASLQAVVRHVHDRCQPVDSRRRWQRRHRGDPLDPRSSCRGELPANSCNRRINTVVAVFDSVGASGCKSDRHRRFLRRRRAPAGWWPTTSRSRRWSQRECRNIGTAARPLYVSSLSPGCLLAVPVHAFFLSSCCLLAVFLRCQCVCSRCVCTRLIVMPSRRSV